MGHKRDLPAQAEVTTAISSVGPEPAEVKPPSAVGRPQVDFAYLREQVTMEQVLEHLGSSRAWAAAAASAAGPARCTARPGRGAGLLRES